MLPGCVIGQQQHFLCSVKPQPELGIFMGTRELLWVPNTSGAYEGKEGRSGYGIGAGGARTAWRLAAELAAGMELHGEARMLCCES
jgi:hypothetical protein